MNVTSMDSFNEWKELIIQAKKLGMTTDCIRYNLILLKIEKNKMMKKESTK